jgi:hypothetical protein
MSYGTEAGWRERATIRRAGGFPLVCPICDGWTGEGAEIVPDWDLAAQPAPDFDVDQRINW